MPGVFFVPVFHTLRFGPFVYDGHRRILLRDGQQVAIPSRALSVLGILLGEAGRTVDKATLIERAWPDGVATEANLMVQVSRLRSILADAGEADRIVTERRVGYRFEGSVVPVESGSGAGSGPVRLVLEPEDDDAPREDWPASLPVCSHLADLLNRLGTVGVVVRPLRPDAADRLESDLALRGVPDEDGLRLRLVNVSSGEEIWTEHFELRGLGEEEFALRIFTRLAPVLDPSYKVPVAAGRSVRADVHLRQGMHAGIRAFHAMRPDSLQRALEIFDRCIEADPAHVPARVYRVLTSIHLWYLGVVRGADLGAVEEHVETALRIAPRNGQAHTARAILDFGLRRDFASSDRAFARAFELAPHEPTAHEYYGISLFCRARFEEARQHLRRALWVDPSSLFANVQLGVLLSFERRFDEALAHWEMTLRMDPGFPWSLVLLAVGTALRGDRQRCEAYLASLERVPGLEALSVAVAGFCRGWGGDEAAARGALARLDEAGDPPHFFRAAIHAALGETDEAVRCLRTGFDDPFLAMCGLAVDPVFDRIRSEAAFRRLLDDAGLGEVELPRRLSVRA